MDNNTLKLLYSEHPATQKRVYYEHSNRLMRVVYRYLESVADAEEVLQDTFLTIYTKIHSFDPDKGSFNAWSHRIAINQALMFLRKEKRLVFTNSDLTDLPISDQLITQPTNLDETEIEYYLNQLPQKAAVVFRLKAIEGYSHSEIAQLLNIRSDASRTIFSRARKKLRKHFIGYTSTAKL